MSPCGEGAVQEDVDRPSPLGAGLGVGRAQQRLIVILGASGKCPSPSGWLLLLTVSRPLFEKRVPSVLTVPSIEHACDEVVNERDLRLGNAAGVSVKHGHHHR